MAEVTRANNFIVSEQLASLVQAQANNAAQNYGIRLNPAKLAPVIFPEQDEIIVLAEE